MKEGNKYIYIILSLILSSNIYANILDIALQKKLYEDSYWLKLLHFKNSKSTILDKNFFLSKNGNKNPKQELIQTIKKFQKNTTYICKYPARYKWLNSKLNLNLSLNDQECKNLNNFLKPNFKSLSIVFTSQRYDSPASMFGHTLLKLNSKTIPYAINYSAKIKDTNPILYAYNGLNGGYISKFNFTPFRKKDYEYRFGEFRDLIEFKLNLNQDELQNILYHFFEIKNISQKYYFLTQNCSSEILKLIDMAKYNSNLSTKLKNIVIPIDIIYILEKKHYIKNIYKQVSKLKLFNSLFNSLSISSQKIVYKIIDYKYPINKLIDDKNLSKKEKYLISMASIYYFEIKSIQQKSIYKKSIYRLMKLIDFKLKYNYDDLFLKRLKLSKNPISNKFHKISYGLNNNHDMIFNYRYLYRDRFDLVDDIKQNGTIELFNIELIKKDSKNLDLNSLTIFKIESIPISNIFFKKMTKKIELGLKKIFEDKKYLHLNYAFGYRYNIDNITYYTNINCGILHNKDTIFQTSLESNIEYNYKNKYIFIAQLNINKYFEKFIDNEKNIYNYIKLNNSDMINIKFSDKQHHKNIEIFYNIFF